MNHPDQDQWVAYLYGEAAEAEKRSLESHAAACAECRARLEEWRLVRARLNQWKTSPASAAPVHRFGAELTRWAAAAVLLAGVGFMLGRSNFAAGGSEEFKAAVSREVKQQVGVEVRSSLNGALEASRTQFAAELRRQLDDTAARASAIASVETKALVKELAQNLSQSRSQDQQEVLKRLEQIEARRIEDFRTLRGELETVAVMTEASLRKTQNQLVKLAGFTQLENRGNPGLSQ